MIQFLVNEWSGMLVAETDETIAAGSFSLTELPEKLAVYYFEVIEDFKNYEGGGRFQLCSRCNLA